MAEICILATYILYETGAHRVFSICIGRQMKQKMGVNKEFSRLAGCASCAVGIASDYQNWYDTYEHSGSIKGKFIFDLGNSSPVFLFNKNQTVLSFIRRNHFNLLPAKDKLGNDVGYGIYASLCKVGKRTIKNVSIGLTDKIYIQEILGCIGPSLFSKSYVIFDTKKGVIYYE